MNASCWGRICGLLQVPAFSEECSAAYAEHETLLSSNLTQSLQPLPFVFDDSPPGESAAPSLAFPDALLLRVGRAVRLGVMRLVDPGDGGRQHALRGE